MGDNNNSLSHAAIEECQYRRSGIERLEHQPSSELNIDIKKLEPAPDCCIYRVPRDLRSNNKKAYTPRFVSIGPFHRRNKELAEMEKQKVRYKMHFGERLKNEEQWDDFITYIRENEKRIRRCYAENIELKSLEFVTMILYDAFFIIEFLLKWYEEDGRDFLQRQPSSYLGIRLDLQLLENQLPYFVLQDLYTQAEFPRNTGHRYPNFFSLSCYVLFGGRKNSCPQVKHFTDLRRNDFLSNNNEAPSIAGYKDIPCAVKLQDSGLNFKRFGDKENQLLSIRMDQRKWFLIPFLKVVELQIPRLEIFDETESLFRNVMALEQCHYPLEYHVCSYVHFLDCLINTEKDVDLLVENGIIVNGLGDNATVMRMFNKLCLNINFAGSYYHDTFKQLNEHYNNPRNRARATLIRVYFSNPWKGTGTIVAIILILFTLIQTICSVQQVIFK